MDFSNLSKQERDRLLLIVMGTILFIVGIGYTLNFGLSMSADVEKKDKQLTKKINQADRKLRRKPLITKQIKSTSTKLKSYIKEVPLQKEYYVWATELIYDLAEKTDLKDPKIERIGGTKAPVKSKKKGKKKLSLEISTNLKIIATGDYQSVCNFLTRLEKEHPFVRIVAIEITKGSKPDSHDVNIEIQWPFNLASLLQEELSIKGAKK